MLLSVRNRRRIRLMTRRDILRLLGGSASVMTQGPAGFARVFEAAAAATSGIRFPKGAIIRATLKDYPPEALGVILFHEHLHGSSTLGMRGGPGVPAPAPHYSEDIDFVATELREAQKDGVSCLVDAGHLDQGSRPAFLKQLSKLSGVPIVISGGYHSLLSYPPEVLRATEDELVDEFVRHAVAERWGALGEIGTRAEITPVETKVLRATGRTHVRTNIPIFTHTANGQAAVEQLDIFESVGVNPRHVVIGHMGAPKMVPLDVFTTICRRGAFVGFDRVGGTPESDAAQIPMIKDIINAGYAEHILLSSDGGSRETQMKGRGGPGHARAYTVFVPKLLAAGVDEATVRTITADNPRRFLAFVPKLRDAV
jgi:phosphotriesterase-related protein